jgi:hypothetical protein
MKDDPMEQKTTNNNYGIPASLLRFLGACVYGNPVSYYGGLNEAERAELNVQGRAFGMTAWFYRYLCNYLPEEKKLAFQKIYQTRQVKAMLGARELKRLYCVLASHGLHFTPIKGADLAYRLYPDAALRSFCDWDIWFHPDDCERALDVLAEDGWKVPEGSSTNLAADQRKGRHHFLGHVRGQYRIEPHYTLANFEEIAPNEMWDCTLDYPNGDGQRVLSPEMNLLMLTRHAATKSYFHAQLPKLLTDAAMVMQNEEVNFDKLRELANKWNLPYSGDLLAAFPEFFPSDVIAGFKSDSKRADAFRQVFEIRGRLGEQENASLRLGRFESRGQIVGGVWKYIYSLSPGKIRHIYHLPVHGAWGRVTMAYLRWGWTRVWKARTWIRRNPLLREYAHMVETAESGRVS